MGGRSQGLGEDPVSALPSTSTQTHPSALPPSHPTPTLPASRSGTHAHPVHTSHNHTLGPIDNSHSQPTKEQGQRRLGLLL